MKAGDRVMLKKKYSYSASAGMIPGWMPRGGELATVIHAGENTLWIRFENNYEICTWQQYLIPVREVTPAVEEKPALVLFGSRRIQLGEN